VTSTELRDYATVVAATVALLVFIFNVASQSRNRRIENLTRFNQAHQRLFAEASYLSLNLTAFESGTFTRDHANADMERRFHLMLLEIERLAILANNNAVPRSTQVYMFGSYAPQILRLMTDAERDSMFWELAVGYLRRIAADIEGYSKLTREERRRFWR
jgi:negative regulator of sigma E activity